MWTLWLVTFGTVVGQGGAPPAVTPLAIYQTDGECKSAIRTVSNGLTEVYGKTNTPVVGVFFCVPGAIAKR